MQGVEEKVCKTCGITMRRHRNDNGTYAEKSWNWKHRNYCSRECVNRRGGVVKNSPRFCEFCGDQIRPKGMSIKDWSERRFCNMRCRDGWNEREWQLDLIDVRHLSSFGIIPDEIARRLGYTRSSLLERLNREGELKLAAYFNLSETEIAA